MDFLPWMLQQNKSNAFFLAGWSSWTQHSFQMKWLCHITLLRLAHSYTPTHQPSSLLVEWNIVTAPAKVHHVVLTNTLLTTSSVSVSFSTSPTDLSWTWTMTAITRTIMTGTVRKPRMAAHTPYSSSACHGGLKEEAKADSSSLLPPEVYAARRCLPHSCQSSCLCSQCCLLLLNSQELTHHTQTHKRTHTQIYLLWKYTFTVKDCSAQTKLYDLLH